MNKIVLFCLLAAYIWFLPKVFCQVSAASLKFDKTTVSTTNGGAFEIAVTVEPGGDNLNSTDVYVTFDSALLKASNVAAGSLFPTVTNDTSTSGRVYIAGMVNDPASSISTTGTLATITFQALKDGSATLSFDCSSSKIIKNDLNATNVITCSSNNSAAVTIGSGAAAPTKTPNQLPESGVFDNVIKFAIPGIILLLLGSAFRLFI